MEFHFCLHFHFWLKNEKIFLVGLYSCTKILFSSRTGLITKFVYVYSMVRVQLSGSLPLKIKSWQSQM